MFPVTSRYNGIETTKLDLPDGRTMVYLRRRLLPPAENSLIVTRHEVKQAERLDNITARYLGDPEQFWRVADANNALQPEELVAEIGRKLGIPLPQGG